MRVLHLSTSAYSNSSCTRLNEALLKSGIKSEILTAVNNKNTYNKCKKIGLLNKLQFKFNSIRENKTIKNNIISDRPVSLSKNGIIVKKKLIDNSDIIHFHWINGGYIGNNSLKSISKLNKKLIWTLHDSWVFTGGCHITNGCINYIDGCKNCLLDRNKSGYMNKIFREKQSIINNMDITFVVPSYEHYKKAKLSPILNGKSITIIPNTIDNNIFFKRDKAKLRNEYKINQEKIIITFGAVGGIKNKFKGVDFVIKALNILSKNKELIEKVEINVFGGSKEDTNELDDIGFKVNKYGYINSQDKLAEIYSISDIFISPSLEESFGQTIAESIYCGNIAIAFDNTGASEIIEHKKNGYLAKYKDLKDLVKGIIWALDNIGIINEDIIEKLNDKFSSKIIAEKYKDIYKGI